MLNRFKVWTYAAVLMGGCMLAGGCAEYRLLFAWLNEDLFG